ncbi:hypothetical protein LAZ67_19001485 [Cordylochernes scorpioides]|uniref:CCHC-type domain-containing protein n=1 Tax=Cordylochernes scorpioides TaxID=51811 RepID=A0ABY6LHR8_9ARAC|nr:hypothetical protein LAZ67_19001485 [Cordylochernes scorpioides]
MLNKAFSNDAPKGKTVFEWHSRFKAGRISIEDEPRQGRPKFQRTDQNVQKITDLIKENPRTTLLELEQDTGISKITIGRIVTKDLKLKKTPAKFIPKFLTNEQKMCQYATCEDMLEMTKTDPEWKDKIIIGDETWVYGYDSETKRQFAEWRGQYNKSTTTKHSTIISEVDRMTKTKDDTTKRSYKRLQRQQEYKPRPSFLTELIHNCYGPSTLPLRLKGLTASNAKKNTKCHYCHKIGHWSRECRKRLANEKNKSKNLHDSKGSSSDYGLILCDNQVEPNDIWYADSGASCSMTFRREWFKTYTPFTSDHPIYLGDNSTLLAEGMGDIEIQAYVDGGWYNTYIRNVLYSPQLKKNLYSLSTSTRRGFNVIIKHDKLQIFMDNDLKAVGVRHDGLDRMLFKVTSSSQGYITSENKLQLWHERLAHLPVATLREMATKGLVDGLQPQDLEGEFFFCEGCQLGKAHRKSCYPSDGKNYQLDPNMKKVNLKCIMFAAQNS